MSEKEELKALWIERMKCEEFGRARMVQWHQGLAMKSKESFE